MIKDATIIKISSKLTECLGLLKKYDWLLNSYVLDFYIKDHWQQLPVSWQRHFENLPIEALAELLQGNGNVRFNIWPLELLAIRQLLSTLCVSRIQNREIEQTLPSCPLLQHHKLKHMFIKCVKPKKQHEIKKMASICARSCQRLPVDFVVDFGAGLGHLARVLGYGYGIKVCCFEMQTELNEQAKLIDKRLESMAAKHLDVRERDHFKQPAHLTERLTNNTTSSEFIESLRKALQLVDEDFSFGIVGLHPCGDLCAILMRMFKSCKQAKFLNFVGCCYQKLSTSQTQPEAQLHGYPMSELLQNRLHNDDSDGSSVQLSYEAREVACHAIEMYHDRLATGQYEYLKIHSFRAAAERIIVEHTPELKHSGLRNVKHTPNMSFDDYFYKAVQGTRIYTLNRSLLHNSETETDLLHWRRIVIFYTLRLMLAPLVESIILYDRMLFLLENGCQVHIEAIFDSIISPRNHITSAAKY
ncbi:protein RRNAD1 [Scaptodrosophila lebanonensis]|uniref:Protein RRNAD1 n=1 Tax=Drosophila lebanonensis TaxID=7225 RepID=A0A6J2TBQ7_DROLE|nr:protein RRNAD1 [Scaptodrosophila lebanonensis]